MLDVFGPEGVILGLESDTKVDALAEMVSHAVKAKCLPSARRDEVLTILHEREDRGSTAFGGGMAVPHARVPRLRKPFGVVARSISGIDFRSVDGEPVHVFVMLVSPENRSDEHLATLRWISLAARHPDFQSFILQAGSPDDVLEVLREQAP